MKTIWEALPQWYCFDPRSHREFNEICAAAFHNFDGYLDKDDYMSSDSIKAYLNDTYGLNVSQDCLDYFMAKYDTDLDDHLEPKELADALKLEMILHSYSGHASRP